MEKRLESVGMVILHQKFKIFFEIKSKKNQLGFKEVFEIENIIQINNQKFDISKLLFSLRKSQFSRK